MCEPKVDPLKIACMGASCVSNVEDKACVHKEDKRYVGKVLLDEDVKDQHVIQPQIATLDEQVDVLPMQGEMKDVNDGNLDLNVMEGFVGVMQTDFNGGGDLEAQHNGDKAMLIVMQEEVVTDFKDESMLMVSTMCAQEGSIECTMEDVLDVFQVEITSHVGDNVTQGAMDNLQADLKVEASLDMAVLQPSKGEGNDELEFTCELSATC